MGGASETDFDCWVTARVDPSADFDGPPAVRTVFGYGSLIFRPGIPFRRAYPACVRGYLRRFWQRSCDHRGTPEAPGRVVTLVEDREGVLGDTEGFAAAGAGSRPGEATVNGVAYEVDEADWPRVLAELDVRERHGYARTVGDLFSPGDHGTLLGRAVLYYAFEPQTSAAYAGPEPLAETARVIAAACGPSGRNDAYLRDLEAALRHWQLPRDPYLGQLLDAVDELQAEEAPRRPPADAAGAAAPRAA